MKENLNTPRAEIIGALAPFFKLPELVCSHVLNRDGKKAWRYLDTRALLVLLCLRRDILKVPFTINDKTHNQRGYRCNLCQLVKDATDKGTLYATAHHGQAFDFIPKGMTAEQARQIIIEHADELPCNIRIERDTSWVHFDTYDDGSSVGKVTLFNS